MNREDVRSRNGSRSPAGEGPDSTGGSPRIPNLHGVESTPEAIARDFRSKMFRVLGRFPEVATRHDNYLALAYAVRDRVLELWINTVETYFHLGSRTVCYLSAEFLLGPQLANNLHNLGLTTETGEAMKSLGLNLEELLEQEPEPGLGNGGLGRLAACYLDSMATLQIPSIGYGIRYEYGIFEQALRDGWQIELTDKWLKLGNPWEIARPEITFPVKLGGRTESRQDSTGRYRVSWIPDRVVEGMAYDTPMVGFRVGTANLLRLWTAEAPESFDFQAFNVGDYYGAVEAKVRSENLTKVLYPNDEPIAGKELRLEQQYFFVSCSLQDMIRIHSQSNEDMSELDQKYAVQLNDTHPAIAVLELQRLLVDEHDLDWDTAWGTVQRTLSYTNHTLLPEALETWPVELFGRILPRHLEILFEINDRFLSRVRSERPGDDDLIRRVSLFDEGHPRSVRMAHVACVGSHRINGVARLHSDLIQKYLLKDFYDLNPEKFTNVTNGVTPRRFFGLANPELCGLITHAIGDGWMRDLDNLKDLVPFAHDASFTQRWREIKRSNKDKLASHVKRRLERVIDADLLFDVQAKRIHEYKRQHLNVLYILTSALEILKNPNRDMPGRLSLFGGKAAPGYHAAKRIIRLVTAIDSWICRNPILKSRMQVLFYPNFNVKNAQYIYPAADLSEQISTAGKEASGTGNMKFSLNGALTIGTLDGANVEIRECVGPENFFLFGLDAAQVREVKLRGYDPTRHYHEDPRLRDVLDFIASGELTPEDPHTFRPFVENLLRADPFLVLADYSDYIRAQETVSRVYSDVEAWTRMSILNVANMGQFSSDRSVRDYARDIWRVDPVPIPVPFPARIPPDGTFPRG